MSSPFKQLPTSLSHLLLAALCLATAATALTLSVQAATQVSIHWDQMFSGRPVHMDVITAAITMVLLGMCGLIATRWALAFLVVFLAAVTTSGTALNLHLVKAALRFAPRIARTTLVTAAGASMVLTAGPALAGDTDFNPQAMSEQNSSASYLGFDSAPPKTPTPVTAPTIAPPLALAPTEATKVAETTEAAKAAASTVVVTAGDSLWSITAQLNPGATAAEISQLWPQLYESNKHVIGSNPDLIITGTELFIPASLSH